MCSELESREKDHEMPNFWDDLSHCGIFPGVMVSVDTAVRQGKISSDMSVAKHDKTGLRLLPDIVVQSSWAERWRQLILDKSPRLLSQWNTTIFDTWLLCARKMVILCRVFYGVAGK